MSKLTLPGGIEVVPLGQAGFRFVFGGTILYVDPYLSNSVQEFGGERFRRMVRIWKDPGAVEDADWCFITHVHADHCDLSTIVPLSGSSARCRFVGPPPVVEHLITAGIPPGRIIPAVQEWRIFGSQLRACAVPAAHPTIEVDSSGAPSAVGYVFEYAGRRIYHAGDTSVTTELIAALERHKPLDIAILPVNERNYYREIDGILGNMTVREAFRLAVDLGVSVLVPIHWDMFPLNAVHREELELYYRLSRPPFEMWLNPDRIL